MKKQKMTKKRTCTILRTYHTDLMFCRVQGTQRRKNAAETLREKGAFFEVLGRLLALKKEVKTMTFSQTAISRKVVFG